MIKQTLLGVLIAVGIASFYPTFAEDKDEIRVAAVKKMEDQSQLAKVAVQDNSAIVRRAAVERLTDQALLTRIAAEDREKSGIVREAAVRKLTDQNLLATIAAGDSRYGKGLVPWAFPIVRTAAVERLADQAVLAKVALEPPPADTTKYRYVQMEAHTLGLTAAKMLTDQIGLAQVAMKGSYGDIRKTAVTKLTDQTALAAVAQDDKEVDIRKAAVDKLTNQSVLAKLAQDDKDVDIRKAAIGKLTDDVVLAKLALGDDSISGEAIKRMNILFVPLPRSGTHCPHGECPTTTLPTNEASLALGALSDPSVVFRLNAVQRLWDQPVLEKIAGSLWDMKTDTMVPFPRIGGVSARSLEPQVRVFAAGAILDTSALERIADYWTAQAGGTATDSGWDTVFAVSHRMKVILGLRRAIQKLGVEDRTGRLRIDIQDDGGQLIHYDPCCLITGVGESVTIWIETDTKIFATGHWYAEMPKTLTVSANSSRGVSFFPAPIDTQQLIDRLLKTSTR